MGNLGIVLGGLAEATSHDRLDIYLTPRHSLTYTWERVRRLAASRRTPVVRLYSPPRASEEKDLSSLGPLRALGPGEVLIEPGVQSFSLAVGLRITGLETGAFRACIRERDATGHTRDLYEAAFTVPERSVDWLLPVETVEFRRDTAIYIQIDCDSVEAPETLYISSPLHIRSDENRPDDRHVMGRAGSRLLDCIGSAAVMSVVCMPYMGLALYLAWRLTRDFPAVAAERRATAFALLRPFAPAFYRDPSRWVLRGGRLQCGAVLKLETLTPRKKLLLGRGSVFLRQLGLDELPQLLNILKGDWSLFGPRAVPNRDGLLAPDGLTVQNSRDFESRYRTKAGFRKPGAFSLRVSMTPRGSIELPPWRTMLLYDRYDSLHWSALHAARVLYRLLLSFVWSEAATDHHGPPDFKRPEVVEMRAPTS